MLMCDAAITVDHRFDIELAGLVRAANQWAGRNISAQGKMTSALSISSSHSNRNAYRRQAAPKANGILAISPPMVELLWGHILADLQMKWCWLKVLTQRQNVNTSCLLASSQFNDESDSRLDRTEGQTTMLRHNTCNAARMYELDVPSDPASCL